MSRERALVEALLRESLGERELVVRELTPVGGGCISPATRARTSAGDFFVKWSGSGPRELFAAEAAGLAALRAAESGLAVPRVVGVRPSAGGQPALIAMEWLEPAGPVDEEALGRGLAALHRHGAERFGFETSTYCGTTPQDNAWDERWSAFYAERRLEPLLRLLESRGALGAGDRAVYRRLLDRLDERLGHETRPSLVHGDLWSGNVLSTARGPGIVDPACAYADREYEFGISTLFGGFGERFFRAYDAAFPLAPGWRERNPLYQLYHLLNHHLLFGGHYGAAALAIARRFAG